MKRMFLLAAIIAVGTVTQAQENSRIQLEETVVNSEQGFDQSIFETTKNTTVITAEEIEEKGAKNIAEALKGVPNLTLKSMGGTDYKFDLRGQGETAFSNVIVLLDGVPLNSIDMSGYKTSQIPINNVERIEVVPAGGTILYGDGALGGIINIVTKQPKDIKNYGSLGVEFGSDNFLKSNINYGTKLSKNTLLDFNYMSKEFDTFRDDSKDNLDAFDVKVKQLLKDGYVDFKYSHSKNDFKAQGSIMGKDETDKHPEQVGQWVTEGTNKYDTYNLNFNKQITEKLSVLLNAEKKEQEYKTNSWGYDTETDYLRAQLKYDYLKESYLILGGDILNGKTKIEGSRDIKKDSEGLFAINKFRIGSLELQQGYRNQEIDYNVKGDKRNFNEDTVDISANYLFNETSSLYLSYNTAFRTPNTDELNLWDGEYKPQTAETIEIGGKTLFGNTYISGAIFKTDTENEIAYAGIDGAGVSNRNLDGDSKRVGGEVSLTQYFEKLTLSASVGYIKHEMKSGTYSGKEIPGVPKVNGNITASYKLNDKIVINGMGNYHGSSYYMTDFKNEGEKLDSYITVDTNIKYQYNEGLEFYVGVNNLFDESYYDYALHGDIFDMPGFYMDTRNYYPAQGRNYYGGFKYNF